MQAGWKEDPQKKYRIDSEKISQYYDSVKSIPLNADAALLEEDIVQSLIEIDEQKSVLDLGCGDGRWARRLVGNCREYVGVDISQAFVDMLEAEFRGWEEAHFICMSADKYQRERRFDIIMIVGLISYMNDEDIRSLSRNCKEMLADDGVLVLRNVALEDDEIRRVYFEKIPLLHKIYRLLRGRRRPSYQLIRRNMESELELFQEFKLLNSQMITGTSLRLYIFSH